MFMKKQYFCMDKQQGFILPYVMFFIAVVMLLVIASGNIYRNEIFISDQLIHELKINTVYQMALTQFHNEFNEDVPTNGSVVYEFPDGKAAIKYTTAENKVTLEMEIALHGNKTNKRVKHIIDLDNSAKSSRDMASLKAISPLP